MKVDKQLFLSQVKQYNANVEQGIDADYGRTRVPHASIATPPFSTAPHPRQSRGLVPGGVKTDLREEARPYNQRPSRTRSLVPTAR